LTEKLNNFTLSAYEYTDNTHTITISVNQSVSLFANKYSYTCKKQKKYGELPEQAAQKAGHLL